MQVLSNVLWVSHAVVCMKKQTVWRTVNAYVVNLFKEKTLIIIFQKQNLISSFSDIQQTCTFHYEELF